MYTYKTHDQFEFINELKFTEKIKTMHHEINFVRSDKNNDKKHTVVHTFPLVFVRRSVAHSPKQWANARRRAAGILDSRTVIISNTIFNLLHPFM